MQSFGHCNWRGSSITRRALQRGLRSGIQQAIWVSTSEHTSFYHTLDFVCFFVEAKLWLAHLTGLPRFGMPRLENSYITSLATKWRLSVYPSTWTVYWWPLAPWTKLQSFGTWRLGRKFIVWKDIKARLWHSSFTLIQSCWSLPVGTQLLKYGMSDMENACSH